MVKTTTVTKLSLLVGTAASIMLLFQSLQVKNDILESLPSWVIDEQETAQQQMMTTHHSTTQTTMMTMTITSSSSSSSSSGGSDSNNNDNNNNLPSSNIKQQLLTMTTTTMTEADTTSSRSRRTRSNNRSSTGTGGSDNISSTGTGAGTGTGTGTDISSATTTTTEKKQRINNNNRKRIRQRRRRMYKHKLCFVTCQYFTSTTDQTDTLLDVPMEVPELDQSELVKFFAYTNQPDRLIAHGWDIVVAPPPMTTTLELVSPSTTTTTTTTTTSSSSQQQQEQEQEQLQLKKTNKGTYKRQITESRWPKFQGYKDPRIQEHCDVVFYMDGAIRIGLNNNDNDNENVNDDNDNVDDNNDDNKDGDGGTIIGDKKKKNNNNTTIIGDDDNEDDSFSILDIFQREAHRILRTPPYMAQTLHRIQLGPGMELRRIIHKQKDTVEHAEASYRFLLDDVERDDDLYWNNNNNNSTSNQRRPPQRRRRPSSSNNNKNQKKLAGLPNNGGDPLVNIPMYENPYFGYAVNLDDMVSRQRQQQQQQQQHNKMDNNNNNNIDDGDNNDDEVLRSFQDVADFFWDHYSKEEDSWRDQPLWSYSLYKLGVTPLKWFGGVVNSQYGSLMYVDEGRIKGGRHTYVDGPSVGSNGNNGDNGADGDKKKKKRVSKGPPDGEDESTDQQQQQQQQEQEQQELKTYTHVKFPGLPPHLQEAVTDVLGFTSPLHWNMFVKSHRILDPTSPLLIGAAEQQGGGEMVMTNVTQHRRRRLRRWNELSESLQGALREVGYVSLTWDYPKVVLDSAVGPGGANKKAKAKAKAKAPPPPPKPPKRAPGPSPPKASLIGGYARMKMKEKRQEMETRRQQQEAGQFTMSDGTTPLSSLKDILKGDVQKTIQNALQDTIQTGTVPVFRNVTKKRTRVSGSAIGDLAATKTKRFSMGERSFMRRAVGGKEVLEDYMTRRKQERLGYVGNTTTTTTTSRNNIPLCFIASQFVANGTNQTDQLLNLSQEVPNLWNAPNISFFLYTNTPDLVAPGWTLLVRDFSDKYSRIITQSRWPKFQAFKDPLILSRCEVVIYMDGAYTFTVDSVEAFQWTAERLLRHPHDDGSRNWTVTGPPPRFAQKHHEVQLGPGMEFRRIVQHEKDTVERADATLKWMKFNHSEDDYDDNAIMYDNSHFWYAVNDSAFQQVANYFWDLYSKEIYSWRDQPLWAYCIHHFHVHPRRLVSEEEDDFYPSLRRNTTDGYRVVDDVLLDFIIKDETRIKGGKHVYVEKRKFLPFQKEWKAQPKARQNRALMLGYNETIWDTFGGIDPPNLAGRKWRDLDKEERKVLTGFGYLELTWDYKMQPVWKKIKPKKPRKRRYMA